MTKEKRKIHFSWWVLVGLCIMLGLTRGGLNNAGGLFLAPVTEDLGIGMGNLTLYFSIDALVIMLILPFVGKIIAKYNIRLVLVTAIIIQAGAFTLFGFMNSVWGWYVLAVPLGIGAVVTTQLAGPVVINRWFKKNNGLALGIMMAAAGLFGAIIQPITGSIIANSGWRAGYISLGLGVLAIGIPAILLLIRNSPEDEEMLPYGMEEERTEVTEEKSNPELTGVSVSAAKKTVAFYSLIVFLFLVVSFGAFAQHIPAYAGELGYSVSFAGSVMGAFSIGMLIGSLTFGFMADKIGAKNTSLIAMVLGIICLIMILLFAKIAAVLIISVALFGITASSIGTLAPLLTTTIFGNKDYSEIYSFVSLGLAVASIVSLPVYGYIYQLTGSYTTVLYALIVMLILALGCIIIAFNDKKKIDEQGLWN